MRGVHVCKDNVSDDKTSSWSIIFEDELLVLDVRILVNDDIFACLDVFERRPTAHLRTMRQNTILELDTGWSESAFHSACRHKEKAHFSPSTTASMRMVLVSLLPFPMMHLWPTIDLLMPTFSPRLSYAEG